MLRAVALALCLALVGPSAALARGLSFHRAKHAIAHYAARNNPGRGFKVEDCLRLSPQRVRCTLTELGAVDDGWDFTTRTEASVVHGDTVRVFTPGFVESPFSESL